MKDLRLIIAFEEWLYSQEWYWLPKEIRGIIDLMGISGLPKSMQWGAFQDFYDSKGIDMYVYNVPCTNIYVYDVADERNKLTFKTRPQARQAALEKAEEVWIKKTK